MVLGAGSLDASGLGEIGVRDKRDISDVKDVSPLGTQQ